MRSRIFDFLLEGSDFIFGSAKTFLKLHNFSLEFGIAISFLVAKSSFFIKLSFLGREESCDSRPSTTTSDSYHLGRLNGVEDILSDSDATFCLAIDISFVLLEYCLLAHALKIFWLQAVAELLKQSVK